MVRLSDSAQGSGSSQAVRKLDARKQQIALQRQRMIAATVAANLLAGAAKGSQAIEAHFDELFTHSEAGYSPAWQPDNKTMLITWETGA